MLHNLEIKIEKIEKYLDILEDFKVDCKKRFLEDVVFEGALLHYLYLVSDSCISLAEMVIKYKSFRTTQSYFDSIIILGEKKVLPREFAYDFAKIASFRNFLAHDYEDVDYVDICENTLKKLDDVKTYLKYIKKVV
jgi:uncharacterized protein YutE (UPF0331/DUF86 family)